MERVRDLLWNTHKSPKKVKHTNMNRKRISKYKRINKPDELPPHRFQDNDTLILAKAGEYRYITTAMLVAITGSSRYVINERTKKLFHHGYLDADTSPIRKMGEGQAQASTSSTTRGVLGYPKIHRSQIDTSEASHPQQPTARPQSASLNTVSYAPTSTP